ncbi:multiple coagulation factor deficiency protein 2 homolog isoform X2 [Asterias amurensis]|uniref:multiple coagulation factor deficiency protein 2 homolog isoform X2 n=1 Tax=Asterias amurensis TaxID=7602 RepID=UPI003AB68580
MSTKDHPLCCCNVYQVLLLTVAAILFSCTFVASSPDGAKSKSKFHDPDVVRNKDHVKEHLDELTGSSKQEKDMNDEELEFHYFKLHDFDNNTKLDGLEILAAISHAMGYEADKSKNAEAAAEDRNIYYAAMIDQVLSEDDFNNDGYLTYLEYVLARRREQRNTAEETPSKK